MALMVRSDRHSRIVLWLKVGLPLVALAILSTLFFVAETLDPEAAIPYADVDVERILREQGMTRPSFGGVTSDGIQISLSADAVRPGQDRRSRLLGSALAANLMIPERGEITIHSPEGIIDADNGEAVLQGGALLVSSNGFRVSTERIFASYLEARITAESEISATGPAGDLVAGSMELVRQTGETPGYLLVFRDGVRLIYEPKS